MRMARPLTLLIVLLLALAGAASAQFATSPAQRQSDPCRTTAGPHSHQRLDDLQATSLDFHDTTAISPGVVGTLSLRSPRDVSPSSLHQATR
jgi:hypothetical protein